jgi:hypothetical protein
VRPKKAYDDQLRHAKARGIPWLFAYEDWLEMWLLSGKWFARGKARGKYQMCRKGDNGAYSKRNCYIGTVEENQAERHDVSSEETAEIIYKYDYTDTPQWKIGLEYGLSQSAVSRIVNQKRRFPKNTNIEQYTGELQQ